MSFNSFRENYPTGFDGLDGVRTEHSLEINGVINFETYSGEDPAEVFEENKVEFIIENIRNGNIEIN